MASEGAGVSNTSGGVDVPVPIIFLPNEGDSRDHLEPDEWLATVRRPNGDLENWQLRRDPTDAPRITHAAQKEDYQRQWREDIQPYVVNCPHAKMRDLFKQPRVDIHPKSTKQQNSTSRSNADILSQGRQAHQPDLDVDIAVAGNKEQDKTNGKVLGKPPEVGDLFSSPQIWKSWQYESAYPTLTRFLKNANPNVESRCEVNFEDFRYPQNNGDDDGRDKDNKPENDNDCLDCWYSAVITKQKNECLENRRQALLDHGKLWLCIRSRFKAVRPAESKDSSPGKKVEDSSPGTKVEDASPGNKVEDSSPGNKVEWMIPCRTLRVTDLSPICAALILGSSPRLDLSYVAPFLERYLNNTNWGTANLITSPGGESLLKTYHLEYHFSFYHVTSAYTNLDNPYLDERNVRKVSWFTAGPQGARTNRIYEEQLSFIIVGHGGDIFTSIQLAERYSCSPEDQLRKTALSRYMLRMRHEEDGASGIPIHVPRGKPCSTFLAWIGNSLRHVVARWQTAITAVDKEVQLPFEATFHGDKHSLLSDDSSFSRSKRYLWAIQVYKVFEKNLAETISVWAEFEAQSLQKLDETQIEHKEESLMTIHFAIQALRNKLTDLKKKHDEVMNLRDGLFSTSQLLDSRVSVRQNDNIRLLTYVNLLFLPLGFCTSVFGIQSILPNGLHMSAFVITMCSVTVFTAFLVLNLQILSEVIESAAGKGTAWLRKLMHGHHRAHWKKTERALQYDRDAKKIPVQSRLRRSTHWMYILFVFESIFITLPVHEIQIVQRLWAFVAGRIHDWRMQIRRTDAEEGDVSAQKLEEKSPSHLDNPLAPKVRQASTIVMSGQDKDRGKHELHMKLAGFGRNAQESVKRVVLKVAVLVWFTIRLCLLPVWLVVVAIELLCLWICLLVLFAFAEPVADCPAPHAKVIPRTMLIPLHLLGFYVKHEKELPLQVQKIIVRWRELTVSRNNRHAIERDLNHIDLEMKIKRLEKPTKTYYSTRREEQRQAPSSTEPTQAASRHEVNHFGRGESSGKHPVASPPNLKPDARPRRGRRLSDSIGVAVRAVSPSRQLFSTAPTSDH